MGREIPSSRIKLFLSSVPGLGDEYNEALVALAKATSCLTETGEPSVSVMVRRLAHAWMAADELRAGEELAKELAEVLKVGRRKEAEYRKLYRKRRLAGSLSPKKKAQEGES